MNRPRIRDRLRSAGPATGKFGDEKSLPTYTGPAQNAYRNSVRLVVQYPQKFPLLLVR
ncbi:MAG: hypothetical protein WBX16_20705 [Candidatus Acidiferrales bacterium]